MKELIIKSPDGNFILTESGEQEIYFVTTRKLIQYYLKETMKKDGASIAQISNSLTIFISSNFKKVDDYLKKLPELAKFIDEPDIEKFQKFMGKYFIVTLQKEKQSLINKETEKSKEKLDNPFWAPSNQMLKTIEAELSKAAPLQFPPNGQGNASVESISQKPDKKEIIKQEVMSHDTGSEPGTVILKSLGQSFLNSKPLDIKSFESKEVNDFEDTTIDHISKKESAMIDTHDERFLSPAGNRLLSEFELIFNKCPPLEVEVGAGKMLDDLRDKIPIDRHIITIKSFASILSNISKFSKNKDTSGYQNWYTGLNQNLKGALKINSLINAEKKGEPVNWGQEIMMFAASTNINKDELYQLTEEVKLYSKIINFIRHRLTNDQKIKLNSQEASNIYTQSINILSGTESQAEKKSALTILLFQISDQSIREILIKDFEKILSTLG